MIERSCSVELLDDEVGPRAEHRREAPPFDGLSNRAAVVEPWTLRATRWPLEP